MVRSLRLRVKQAFREEASVPVTEEEIARVAYALFERRGRTHGNHQQDWIEAERMLRTRRRRGNGR